MSEPQSGAVSASPESIQTLRNISTATIATLLFKRGFRNAYIQGVSRLGAARKKMAGPAFTLRYIVAREDTDPISSFRNHGHPQRVAIETCPQGHVLVMDCRQDARAASAGSILLNRLQVRGGAGCVTDGGIRDADGASDLDMPVFAAKPSAPTNLTRHHAVDINVPISCGGVPVYPGDVVVGDGDGVMVVPSHLADEIATEGAPMEQFEAFVMEEINRGVSILGLYPPTDPATLERFEKWQASNRSG